MDFYLNVHLLPLREKTLTIYCDESGDLGGYYKESPVYCLSLVLVSSEDDATPYLREFHRRCHSKKAENFPSTPAQSSGARSMPHSKTTSNGWRDGWHERQSLQEIIDLLLARQILPDFIGCNANRRDRGFQGPFYRILVLVSAKKKTNCWSIAVFFERFIHRFYVEGQLTDERRIEVRVFEFQDNVTSQFDVIEE